MDERLGLAGVLALESRTSQVRAPHALQLRDVVPVKSGQRRVTLVEEIPPISQPALARQRDQLILRERRRQPYRRKLLRYSTPIPPGGCQQEGDTHPPNRFLHSDRLPSGLPGGSGEARGSRSGACGCYAAFD